MAKIISGKELSARLKAEMAAEVATFPARYGRVPHLAVILVGEDPGSVSYVTGKAILKLLQDTCRQKGVTVVVITHNTALTPMADRVIHIREGRVAAVELNDHPLSAEVLEW